MSELLLKLNVSYVVVAVGRHVVNVRSSIFVVDDDFAVFITAILRVLYKEEV